MTFSWMGGPHLRLFLLLLLLTLGYQEHVVTSARRPLRFRFFSLSKARGAAEIASRFRSRLGHAALE
jgi:hypothetical protein